MTWRFRPPLWAWVGTLALGALLVSLGTWQLGRGQHKARLEAEYAAASSDRPPGQLGPELQPARSEIAVKARGRGRYLPERQILLDNQPRQRVPGYRVWTPLRLDTGALVVIDRGWVAADPDRRVLPDTGTLEAEPREVSGYWRPFPEPGLRLDGADPCAVTDAAFPRVLSFPTRQTVSCVLGEAVLPGLLLLAEDHPDGFVREWTQPNPVPPARHYAYAAQWYAFAATLLFLFVKLNLRRS